MDLFIPPAYPKVLLDIWKKEILQLSQKLTFFFLNFFSLLFFVSIFHKVTPFSMIYKLICDNPFFKNIIIFNYPQQHHALEIQISKLKKMKQFADYREICQIGEGAFGRVYKAVGKQGQSVAIKHIKFENQDEGIPSTALREISLLKSLKSHPNIVPLIDVCYKPKQKNLQIVFDFYDYDLKKYLNSKSQKLNQFEIKSILKQILNGLSYCHCRKVLHRDLKPQNILIDNQGNVKLADFGLGRVLMIPLKTLTHQVETLWYRAPQILLGQQKYTFAVDVWAVGCIFAELWLKKPLFVGNGYEIEQIFTIFQTLGTPTLNQWPDLINLPDFKSSFPRWNPKPLQKILPSFPPKAIDLLSKLLELNPENRITALGALEHQYLSDL